MKKGITVMFFICLCLAVSVLFPRLSLSHLMVDASGCCVCHDFSFGAESLHGTHTDCFVCHGVTTGLGTVEASSCLACHPQVNAEKCDLMESHETYPDYEPAGESCLDCHAADCDGSSTTTTTAQVTTTKPGSTCPSKEIYGEGSLEVTLLRAVRDTVLSQTPEGREIIKLYYQWSPVITMALRNDKAFKAEIKELLDGMLSLAIE